MFENKLIAQVNHRTLASLMTLLITYKTLGFIRMTNLTPISRIAAAILLSSVWMQLGIGVTTIWQGAPIHLASSHQIGAMCVLSSFLFAMHTCRKPDPRHIRNLVGKLKIENPTEYRKIGSDYQKYVMSQ